MGIIYTILLKECNTRKYEGLKMPQAHFTGGKS
jgi:hypothetical protein